MKKNILIKIGIIAVLSLFLGMGVGFAENGAAEAEPAAEANEPSPAASTSEASATTTEEPSSGAFSGISGVITNLSGQIEGAATKTYETVKNTLNAQNNYYLCISNCINASNNNCTETCKTELDRYIKTNPPPELTPEQRNFKYTTLKELTFDVQETLNIDPNVTERKTPKEQSYFSDEVNPPLVSLILYTIDFAIRVMGSLAVLILIIGGMILVLSAGNDTRVEKGKNTIKYAVIGIAVSMMAYVIVMIVQALLTN
jgi:hypothetical protein